MLDSNEGVVVEFEGLREFAKWYWQFRIGELSITGGQVSRISPKFTFRRDGACNIQTFLARGRRPRVLSSCEGVFVKRTGCVLRGFGSLRYLSLEMIWKLRNLFFSSEDPRG